jgi:hypothetical protein
MKYRSGRVMEGFRATSIHSIGPGGAWGGALAAGGPDSVAQPRRAAEDLAGTLRGRQEASGVRPPDLRLLHGLGHLGEHRAVLPITKAAYEKVKASGFYKTNPYLETPRGCSQRQSGRWE